EYNSVIAQDITDADAGSKKVDAHLGEAYKGLHLATRAATVIFMYSFSGGPERGATLTEIKRTATTLSNPASVVAEALEQLKNKLYYFQFQSDKYFFSNTPNINRIILTKMENVSDNEVREFEKELLKQNVRGDKLKVFIWEENSSSIPDTEELKLIFLPEEKTDVIGNILKSKGTTPRVNCNTLFFVFPTEIERASFTTQLKRYKAYLAIEHDRTLPLSEEQRKELQVELKKRGTELHEALRRLYRQIAIPSKDGYKKDDLGIPTYGEQKPLEYEVYSRLCSNGEIVEQLVPLVIKERYLGKHPFVSTAQILQASYRVPGEPRVSERSVLQKAIADGVEKGVFGLGELENNTPVCRFFREVPLVEFSTSEVLLNAELCKEQKNDDSAVEKRHKVGYHEEPVTKEVTLTREPQRGWTGDSTSMDSVCLEFEIPKGKVSDVSRIINYLQNQFETILVTIKAGGGKISKQDYENKILEALRQLGIEAEEK
ncbi:MAG: ATP-binding protein, partial [Bacteroidetes bacterium]|nr:ATP-binding protein [Bacteroidota bacterium]